MQPPHFHENSLKRILLVLNKPNRELSVMHAIRREIAALAPAAEVAILPYDAHFFEGVLAFKPTTIMTFPMTSIGLSPDYYLFKHFFHCRVVCFRAEGILDPKSTQSLSNHLGYDKYGRQLVDGEIFWGPGPARLIGKELVAKGKLESLERVLCFGYPRLERYFGITPPEVGTSISGDIADQLASYGSQRTILVATGFHFANYTRDMIFAAKDLDAENRCDELLGIIEEVKRFRASWIQATQRAAAENPDFLFVLKKHPIERREDYAVLEGIPNILYIWQDIDIGDLVERSGLFFHYGSTALADAYLAHVPAVYVHSLEARCHDWYTDLGWPSERTIHSDEIPTAVADFRAGRIKRDPQDLRVKAVLEFNFNIRDGERYLPSRGIAEYLLHDVPAQHISLFDAHYWRALSRHCYLRLRRNVGRPVKRALRAAKARFQQ